MYTVVWLQTALNDLARAWTNADTLQREVITKASYSMDAQLQSDPESIGESRSEGQRVAFEPPIGVLYEVHADQETVVILHFWTYHVPS